MDFAAADQGDMAGLRATQIFLKEHALGIIDVPQPGTGVLHRLAQDCMNRAGWRAKRIFDDVWPWMLAQDAFGRESVLCDMSFGKRDAVIVTKLSGEIAFALDAHAFAGRAKDGHAAGEQFLAPRRLRPVNGHRNDQARLALFEERDGAGKIGVREGWPRQRRRVMAGVACEVSSDLRPGVLEDLRGAVSERTNAEYEDGR